MSTVTRVVSGVRGFSTAIKDVARLREIVSVLVRHGFGAFVGRLRLGEVGVAVETEAGEPVENAQQTRGQRVRLVIEELGPTFIKLGQILSTRPDLIPRDITEELSHLQDRVPPLAFEAVRAQVESELGAPLAELFASFEAQPLASASIAQVHRAVLNEGGTEVVVKVQRPALEPRIDADLNVLAFLARQAEMMVPELELVDPVGIIAEFERALRRELDFANERGNIERFLVNFDGFEGVRIPRVFPRQSTGRVLTMEYLTGVKVTRAPEVLGLDPYPVARRMLRALFKMVFHDGYFHGDLHPGNVLIEPDGTIDLIDFGLVGRLNDAQRDNVLDILVAVARNDHRSVARIYFDLGIKVRGVSYDYASFEADVVEVMERHVVDKTLSEIDIGAFFSDLVAGAIKHRIKMPSSYTMVFKALMTVEGIGKELAPDINFIEEAQPFVEEVVTERYRPERLMREGAETLNAMTRFVRTVPNVATHLLLDAQKGDLSFRVQSDALERFNAEYLSAARRQSQAIAFSGAVIAGVLAVDAGGPRLLGLSWLAIVLFCAAAWVGYPLFFSRLRMR